MRTRFTIVVPAWNALHHLRVTLPAMKIAAARHGSAEIVVVDNGSADGTARFIADEHPDVHLLKTPKTSIGSARNLGAAYTDTPYIAFIDADCVMEDLHVVMAEQVLQSTEAGVVGSSYALPEHPNWIESAWHALHSRTSDGFVRLIPAGNLVVARHIFERVGGFDSDLITGEDADLCERLSKLGCVPYSSASVRAVHLGNPKSLRAFFRRNVWHSLGRGRPGWTTFDRPYVMTVAHTVLVALGIILMVSSTSVGIRASGPALLFAVPAVSVSYRLATRGAGVTWRRAPAVVATNVILYWLYYAARGWAILLTTLKPSTEYTK